MGHHSAGHRDGQVETFNKIVYEHAMASLIEQIRAQKVEISHLKEEITNLKEKADVCSDGIEN